jgi:hypothetical protein
VDAVNIHVFQDNAKVMGNVLCTLQDVYELLPSLSNSTVLFHLLSQFPSNLSTEWKEVKKLQCVRESVQNALSLLKNEQMKIKDSNVVYGEFVNASNMLLHAVERGIAYSKEKIDTSTARLLANQMRFILGEHRRLWTLRNRPGGLQQSTKILEKRLLEYEVLSH